MTRREYESEVLDASVAADRLSAVIELFNEYYFNTTLGDDLASREWWNASHDNIQGVVGAIFASITDLRSKLDKLCGEAITTQNDREEKP